MPVSASLEVYQLCCDMCRHLLRSGRVVKNPSFQSYKWIFHLNSRGLIFYLVVRLMTLNAFILAVNHILFGSFVSIFLSLALFLSLETIQKIFAVSGAMTQSLIVSTTQAWVPEFGSQNPCTKLYAVVLAYNVSLVGREKKYLETQRSLARWPA